MIIETRNIGILIIFFFVTACVSIPRETVTLSQTLENDLHILQRTHQNMVEAYFHNIKNDINSFIDDVYAPFIIHYVLNIELENYSKGNHSIYGVIDLAGKNDGKEESENAIIEMQDFLSAARKQIEDKRKELMSPIIEQEIEILTSINQSYENAIYASSTITGYLLSARKVKETQQEALSMIGLAGADTVITNNLVRVSDQVDQAVKIGREIDIQSDSAFIQIEEMTDKIKKLTINN